ncbi:MAG: hypothetical protein HDS65_03740 [Bacteroidales bacterium]|nr:hypothetical protein [Bacteroidales bacterium]
MKKLLAGALFAATLTANAAVGGIATQEGYTLKLVDVAEGISTAGTTNRSGVGVNGKFYVNYYGEGVRVYSNTGELLKTIPPTAGYHNWVSCNADQAGHVLVQLDVKAFDGSCSANGGHGFMVIDSETDEVIVPFLPMTFGYANRFDAMSPMAGNILETEKAASYSVLNAGVSSYRFLYNQPGAEAPSYWQTRAFATSAGIVGTEEVPTLFPEASTQTTLGYAMQYTFEGETNFNLAVYANPVYNVTYSANGFGNGIRKYGANEKPVEPAQWFYTPQHSGLTGFNFFNIAGVDYIIYPAGQSNVGGDAFAICEVSYVDTPISNLEMEGESLVDGKPAGVMKARVFAATNESGATLYNVNSATANSYNIEPVEGDANSVYIYVYTNGAPGRKFKFTVGEEATEPEPVATEVTIADSQLTAPGKTTVEGFTVDIEKGAGSTAPKFYAAGMRLYAKNTLTISAENITSIKFNLAESGNKRYAELTASTGTVSAQANGDTEVVWTGDASEVTFTVGDTSIGEEAGKVGQFHFNSIVITGIGGEEPEQPELPEGTGEGTVESPYDVAKVLYMIANGTNDENAEVYVKGEITSITEVSTSFGNATYTISDKGTDNSFGIYRGYALGNQKFTSEDEIKVGDEVVVFGKVVNYNGNTPQMTTGNYIYSLNGETYEETEQPVEPEPDFSDCTGTEEATITAPELTTVPGITKFTGEGECGYGFETLKNDGTTDPQVYTDNQGEIALRLYAKNTLTVAGGKLTSIRFVLASSAATRYTTFTASTGTVAEQAAGDTEVVWTGDATEVTFTVGDKAVYGTAGESKAGQIHISEIIINESEEEPEPEPAVTAALGTIATQEGYSLEALWTADNISVAGTTNRSGVGVNDKFYVNYYGEGVRVYSNTGVLLKTIPATEGYHNWVSCNADQAGHVLVQLDVKAFDGTCSPNGDHGFMVIDSETDEVIVPFLPMTFGYAQRFDAMAPVQGNILETEKVGIWTPLNAGTSTYRILYNQPGAAAPSYWQTAAMITGNGIVTNDNQETLFPADAAKQTSTGYAMQYVFEGEENFHVPVYANPVYNVTYSAAGKYGNGIRKYNPNYTATDQWFYTPQHSGLSAFNFFNIAGKDYVIYPAGGATLASDAFAIAEVSYVDGPATNMDMEGETLVDGKLAGTLKARVYCAMNEAGTLPLYAGSASTLVSYNVVPVEGEDAVYIYVYGNGAPGVKYKFTVAKKTSAVDGIEAELEDAPVEYYNLQGIRVANPEHGFYIKRQGNKTTKVIL